MNKTFLRNFHYLDDTQVKNFYKFLQISLSKSLEKMPNPIIIELDKLELFESLLELFNTLIEEKQAISISNLKKNKKDISVSFNPYKFLYFNTTNFFIEGPEFTSRECLENGYTYNIKIFLESKFYDNGSFFNNISSQIFKNTIKLSKIQKKFSFENFWFRQKHLLCHIPFITEQGTFIINGCERVIINQLIRSPGIYFLKEKYTNDISKHFYNAYIISEKGKWTKITLAELENNQPRIGIEFTNNKLGEIWTKEILTYFSIDDGYEDNCLSLFYLLNQFGINLNELNTMIQYPGHLPSGILNYNYFKYPRFQFQIPSNLDLNKLIFFENFKELIKLNKKWFNSEINIKEILLESLIDQFYNPQYGSFLIGEIGRLQINNKLGIQLNSSINYITPIDLIGIVNGLIKLKYFDKKNDDIDHLRNKWVRSVGDLFSYHISSTISKSAFLKNIENPSKIGKTLPNDFKNNLKNEVYFINQSKNKLNENFFSTENFESQKELTNFEKLTEITNEFIKKSLKIYYFLDSSIAEFCSSSPLVQLTQLANQLSLLNQKRKFSLLGPLGLKADQVSIEVRDIHPSKYSKICYIETADGPRVGLVSSLASFGRVNRDGLFEAPYFLKKKGKNLIEKNYIYLTADDETKIDVEISNINQTIEKGIKTKKVTIKKDCNFLTKNKENLKFSKISPFQTVSIGISLIPFLEHDDATRVLMGSNMQRQAVPLIFPQKVIVGTGIEANIAKDSGMCLKSYSEGYVIYADNYKIKVKDLLGQQITYSLRKYKKAYQDTCYNHKTCVWNNEKIFSSQIIADGPGSIDGELALGTNLTIAYMPWYGYNYEDAIVISSKLLENNNLTSIHITEQEIPLQELETYQYDFLENKKNRKKDKLKKEKKLLKNTPKLIKNNKLSIDSAINEEKYDYPEQLSENVSNSNPYLKRHLNKFGLVKIGSYVQKGDILLGKLKIVPMDNANPYIRLLNAILKKNKNEPLLKDISIKMESSSGRVIAIKSIDRDFLTRPENYEPNLLKLIKIYIVQTRKIEVGDKLSGRHGNKGVISKIIIKHDMPYLPDGSPIDIILNPLGVPSRMNVGQIFESILGFAGYKVGKRYKIDPFDESYSKEASRILINQKLKEASYFTNLNWLFNPNFIGKILLRDGRTGEFYDNSITVGKSYILKLVHLIEDKIHSRATGSYSLINEQPLAGRASNGGQRFGEMEVWAMEAYGSSYTLQELLTIKSDDCDGRNDIYEVLASKTKKFKPNISISESYVTLIRHLNALGLNFSFKAIENNELQNQDLFESLENRLKLRALLEKNKLENRDDSYEKEISQIIEKEVQSFYNKLKINLPQNL
jgi:DNA-directed RNA polymerase subunit beta